MKQPDKTTQIAILQQTYITIDDIYHCLPIGKNYASRLFREIEAELQEKGIILLNTRPRVIPTEYLIKRYPELKKIKKG